MPFNAQGSRVIIIVVHIAAVEALTKQGRQDNLSLPAKLLEKLVWVLVNFVL